MHPLSRRLFWIGIVGLAAAALTAAPALAQGLSPDAEAVRQELSEDLNILWTLLAGFLVFFMQAGFAPVETGFTRAKNAAHTMMMNMMVFCIGALGYFLVGFALQFGEVNHTYPAIRGLPEWNFAPTSLGRWVDAQGNPLLATGWVVGGQHGVLGWSGFGLSGLLSHPDTAATIPTGAMAERLKFIGFVLMGLWASMVVYPIVGGWVWGGGWLANLGRTAGLGNGG